MNQVQDIRQDSSADIARRSLKRNAEARDRRVMFLLFGIMAFLGIMGLLGGLLEIAEGTTDVWMLVQIIGLSALYIVAAWRLWSHDDMRFWVIGAPIVIPMIIMATDFALGLAPLGIPILHLLMLGLYLLRRRTLAAARALMAPRLSEVPG